MLTERQHDATASALDACHRIGMYKALGLNAFRNRPCSEVVTACQKSCPIDPGSLGTCLTTFLTRLIGNLQELGYQPQINMTLLCAVRQTPDGLVEWTWRDWCDYLARRL